MASVKRIAISRKETQRRSFQDLNLEDRITFKEQFTKLKMFSNDLLGVDNSESSCSSVRRDAIASSSGCVIPHSGEVIPRGSEVSVVSVSELKEKQALLTKLLRDLQELEYKYLNGGDFLYKNKRSRCVVDFIHSRMAGNQKLQSATLAKEFGINHMLTNNLFKEKNFKLDSINKVFCSQWLSDRQVVFGTKCNKVMLLDVFSGKIFRIPNLKSSAASKPPENSCGIHSIEINPSKTLLATGGENANDIAVYKLPTLDPLCVAEGAHTDWTFDIAWLDDEFLVSGSRDSTLALWRVDPENERCVKRHTFPNYYSMGPQHVKNCKQAEKIRAVIFNENQLEIVALSLNAQIHVLDAQTLEHKSHHKLQFPLENVCLSQDSKNNLYAVGSKSHVTLFDTRSIALKSKILSKYQGQGVRSISFSGNILTIGTGCGVLLFYDIRADKYIERLHSNAPRDDIYAKLCATRGWVLRDESYQDFFSDYKPAIYTHQYDKSGTRLFAAGGPLPASLQGNYAGLWD